MKSKHLNNEEIILINKAREIDHQLVSSRAAFRLLQGAVLTGAVDPEAANLIVPDLLKYETNSLEKEGFGKEFFTLAGKPNFKKTVSQKYKSFKSGLPKLAGKQILIIDDQFNVAGWNQILTLLFGKDTIVGRGARKSALEFLEQNGESVICILVDLRLPKTEEQGISLIAEICSIYPQIPVVVFSGSDSVVYAKQAFKAGAWNFFPKQPEESIKNSQYRNPIDYFQSFYELIKAVVEYDKFFVDRFWTKIIAIENVLRKYDKQSGGGIAGTVTRELKKAYRHLIFERMNSFVPAFLSTSYYDEAIYCCSKAFECGLSLYSQEKGINEERIQDLQYGSKGLEITEKIIALRLKSLGDLVQNMKSKQKTLGLSEAWFVKADEIRRIRNRYIHGYFTNFSNKSSKLRPADEKMALKVMHDTIYLIQSISY